VNALLHHCRGGLAGIGGVERPGIVHRLDKGTSGCIVVAKTDFAHQALVAQFKSRDVKKTYHAVCRGRFERSSGRVETLIGRSERDRKKMSARVTRGRAAVTDYRVLKQFPDFALVELRIHTGRTHQIRVHMAHIGHPVLGDTTYGGKTEERRAKSEERNTKISEIEPQRHRGHGDETSGDGNRRSEKTVARPMLHAYKLCFTHPRGCRQARVQREPRMAHR